MPEYFNRPPRIQPELPTGEVEIPAPPNIEPPGRMALVALLLPFITIIGYVLVSAGRGSGSGAGGMLFVIPMAITVVATGILGIIGFISTNRQMNEKTDAYKRRLIDIRNQVQTAHDKQRNFYRFNYPEPHIAVGLAGDREEGGPDSRLWERRTTDDDFGSLRLGVGTVASSLTYKAPNQSAEGSGSIVLLNDALKIADDAQFVTDVPIIISLRSHTKEQSDESIAAQHAIGVAGHERAKVNDFVRAMLVHFAAFHAPTDARLYVIGSPDSKPQWDWARWLPHTNTSRNESSAGDQLRFEARKIRRLWDDLQSELERRQLRLADKDNSTDVTIPFLLVVVDGLTPKPGESPLKDVEAEAAVSMLLHSGAELGAAIIFLVPDASIVPSECKAIIEVEPVGDVLGFRYAEIGVNTSRYDGVADVLDSQRAEQDFARKLAPMAVRTTYGADLAAAITLLELNHAETVDQLPLLANWRESRKPEKADWLHVPVGLLVGNKIRDIVFSADGDGVHGLAAGTTGSGKSELLLTIITGLAVNYDPSIVNFVLVDYKGGAAFEPFRTLPHCVDIVTNLQGMAGARTFIALRAELNRRSKILADANVKHIVHYRSKNLHITREPFPHLFVIIDEFAEMIKEMPEFKAQLDSIARLGRALGVHLLLATQRPSGVVSDQIRANMKFRICLRVETPDDSRELLRRSDAAFLPPNIPGRAYLQVGNENVELMQVARAGGPYTGPQVDAQPPVMWLTRMEKSGPNQVMARPGGAEAAALSDVIVEIAARLAAENEDVKPQKKPWPDPLPARLPLEAEFLGNEPNPHLPLNPAVIDWLEGQGQWKGLDWTEKAMKAVIGLIDNPHRADQLTLTLDLTRGHAVLFGSSGWGKTTFLRTVMTSLAATHSPDELHMYVLDFGGRGLDIFQGLPHLGASILPSEDERVQRLLRKIGNMLEERKSMLSQARSDNLLVYNANNPDKIIPAVLVIVDNFAEFKENFENLMEVFMGLVRDGRAYGIHFVVTGEQPNAIPGKLYSLFTERMTLKLADAGEYSGIVGRGVPGIDDIPGRGFISVDRTPLEFQTALPVGVTPNEEASGLDDTKKLAVLVQTMSDSWHGRRPEGIDVLRPIIPLKSLLTMERSTERVQAVLGLEDLDLKPATVDLQARGPHFVLIGPPLSGKTTALRSWVISLAHAYSPDRVAMVLIDFQQRFFKYGGKHTLGELPHVLATVSEINELNQVVTDLKTEYETPLNGAGPRPEIFIFADNYDDFANVIGSGLSSKSTAYKDLSELGRKFGPEGFHLILCGSLGILRSNEELMRQALAPRYGLGLDASDAPQALGGRVRSGAGSTELPPGRGYMVKSGRSGLIQVATPQNENNVEASLDAWVEEIVDKFPERSQWTKDKIAAEHPAESAESSEPTESAAPEATSITEPGK
jgi:S-DNA-T family DNA segregation ATPase FtsK/SpoIIIE